MEILEPQNEYLIKKSKDHFKLIIDHLKFIRI